MAPPKPERDDAPSSQDVKKEAEPKVLDFVSLLRNESSSLKQLTDSLQSPGPSDKRSKSNTTGKADGLPTLTIEDNTKTKSDSGVKQANYVEKVGAQKNPLLETNFAKYGLTKDRQGSDVLKEWYQQTVPLAKIKPPTTDKLASSADVKPATSGVVKPASSGDAKPTSSEDAKPASAAEAKPSTSGDAKPATAAEANPTFSIDPKHATSGDAKQTISVDANNGVSWKQTGNEWNFFDANGKKVEKYEGKVSGISRDANGDVSVKLNDGRSLREKTDGSVLEYDSAERLKSVTYKNGSSRKFDWEDEQLIGIKSDKGQYERVRDDKGKLKDEWKDKKENANAANWLGQIKVNGLGDFSVNETTYHSDLTVETKNNDGSRQITYPNKDVVKVSKEGHVAEVNYSDGTKRNFTWSKNPDAKGTDDNYTLSGVQVLRDGKTYYHSRGDGDKWNVQTWENGKWSAKTSQTTSFDFDQKSREYSYIDSSDGIKHILQPGGIEKTITSDGAKIEYEGGNLSKVSKDGKTREFEWQDKKLVAIKDGVQDKVWKPAEGGGWASNRGDKKSAEAIITPTGDIVFKNGNRAAVIDNVGSEFTRISNDKEKSHVEIKGSEIKVSAGDGSSRTIKTAADGKEVIQESITRNGKSETWTRGDKLANGNYTWTSDQQPGKQEERKSVTQNDGALKVEYPEGKVYQSLTSGAEKLENNKAGWSIDYVKGRPSEFKYPDGTVRKFTFDDKSDSPKTVEINAPGKPITKYEKVSEGHYKYTNSLGKEAEWKADFTVNRDGLYRYTDNDEKGKTTTRQITGHALIQNPADGSRIEKYKEEITKVSRDNKTVEVVRGSDNEITEVRDYTSNTAYTKNKNSFEASAIDAAKPFVKDGIERHGFARISEDGSVSFEDHDGTHVKQLPGQKGELLSSKEKSIEAALQNSAMKDEEKERLKKTILDYTARIDIEPKDKVIFLESVEKFAKRTDINDKEKAETYSELSRLLESKSDRVFNSTERALLAEQLIWHVANPTENQQGYNPTCQVTAIRGKLLYDHPAAFARVMTDVITTGEYKTADGSIIKPPTASLRPSKNSDEEKFPGHASARTWLGKISDVTLVNTHWQRSTVTPGGLAVEKGKLIYQPDPSHIQKDAKGNALKGDTGERVFQIGSNGLWYPQNDSGGALLKAPGLYSANIANVYKQIVGGKAETVILAAQRKEITAGPGVAILQNEDQLHKQLMDGGIKIAQIWTGEDWVRKEPNRKHDIKAPETEDGEHVVLVKDYDPKTKTCAVDNSWGSKHDYLNGERRITLHELYKAMAKQ